MYKYFLILLVVYIVWYSIASAIYRKTDYYKSTKRPYFKVIYNKGFYGEYLTYMKLRTYEKDGAKFLYNCYLPRDNGRTTEVDVMMVHSSGVYVFESKNYSGWIFGSENQKTWTQTLPNGRKSRKEHFLNPIMQNKLHIKWLKNQIGEDVLIHSVIVFSERCTLKSIKLKSDNVFVIKRNSLQKTVKKIKEANAGCLENGVVEDIYQKLYSFTQVSDEIKEKHVADIKMEQSAAVSELVNDIEAEMPNEELIDAQVIMKCPKCGGTLVKRISKRGQHTGEVFLGCSNYPKCKYISNATNTEASIND